MIVIEEGLVLSVLEVNVAVVIFNSDKAFNESEKRSSNGLADNREGRRHRNNIKKLK